MSGTDLEWEARYRAVPGRAMRLVADSVVEREGVAPHDDIGVLVWPREEERSHSVHSAAGCGCA